LNRTVVHRPGPPRCAGRARGRRASRGAGFSLVEVLVAMLVASVGVLALAALLQASTRYAKTGQLRATAALLASDIADRIRANPPASEADTGDYDLTGKAFPSAPPPPRAPCSSDAPCDSAGLAQLDLAHWMARVRATLPRGSAWVQGSPARPPAPGHVDIWVGWADPLTPSPGPDDRSDTECPEAWKPLEAPVRCIHLQVTP
jgi:type IV pilus assembly protein PilV